MDANEMTNLTTKVAENALAIAVVDKNGNVVVRYFDQTIVDRDAKKAGIVLKAIGDIVDIAKAEQLEKSNTSP